MIAKREIAQAHHQNIMNIFNQIEITKKRLPCTNNWLRDPELSCLFNKLRIELNDLGYLINKRAYDKLSESIMLYHSVMAKITG
jgi:hypothetical protein